MLLFGIIHRKGQNGVLPLLLDATLDNGLRLSLLEDKKKTQPNNLSSSSKRELKSLGVNTFLWTIEKTPIDMTPKRCYPADDYL